MYGGIVYLHRNLSIISIDSQELLYGLPIHLFDILSQYLVRKNKNVDKAKVIKKIKS